MKNLVLSFAVLGLFTSCSKPSTDDASLAARSSSSTFKVDEAMLNNAMDVLLKTAAPEEGSGARFIETKVVGSTTKEMLTDFGHKRGYEAGELKILMRMTASELPEVDGGEQIIGLAKNVDVVHLAVDLYSEITDDGARAKLRKTALTKLFDLTKAGAFVGVESSGWGACGVMFPSLIILNPEKKKVFSLAPKNTDC